MSLELLLGPMWAGKSSAILSRIRRYRSIGKEVYVITHQLDKRYTEKMEIKSHDGEAAAAVALSTLSDCVEDPAFERSEYVIIEEAQFFEGLRDFVLWCVEYKKKNVLVVGLDGDSNRRPFGEILDLIPYCDKVEKMTAFCKRCGDGTAALFSARVRGDNGAQVCVGAADKYEAMCRRHFLENTV
jgi:thymidine kinase